MNDTSPVTRSTERPDWAQVLLAATLASWGVFMIVFACELIIRLLADFSMLGLVQSASTLISGALITFFAALIVCIVAGLPALALVNWLRLDRWWHDGLIGAVAGFAFIYGVLGSREFISPSFPVSSVLLFVVAGALAGVAAWRERRKE